MKVRAGANRLRGLEPRDAPKCLEVFALTKRKGL